MTRPIYLLGWSFVAFCSWVVLEPLVAAEAPIAGAPRQAVAPFVAPEVVTPQAQPGAETASGSAWFQRIKPFCNSLEATTAIAQSPPPQTVEGAGYHASCLALAGRVDDARAVIDTLPVDDRARAAYIVFDVGHPVADAGDDKSAGPMMEIVVDYVPSHYMALYHAGVAQYMLGQRDRAKKNLEAFLVIYTQEDGWRSNARDMITKMNNPAELDDISRPRDP